MTFGELHTTGITYSMASLIPTPQWGNCRSAILASYHDGSIRILRLLCRYIDWCRPVIRSLPVQRVLPLATRHVRTFGDSVVVSRTATTPFSAASTIAAPAART